MDPQAVLDRITTSGAIVAVKGDRLVVRSKAPLTDQQREFIRTHKPILMDALLRQARDQIQPPPHLTATDRAALNEAIEERAAIQEHDGRLSHVEAERQAQAAVRVYHYRVTDKPAAWLTLICPGCDLEAARYSLTLRFGDRLMDVVEHEPRRPRA